MEEQFEFVGEGAGEQRVSDPAVPTGEWAGAVFLFHHFHLRIALEHPGVEFVRPARVGLAGQDAMDGGDD